MDVCSDYGTPSKNVETDAETAEPGTNEKDSEEKESTTVDPKEDSEEKESTTVEPKEDSEEKDGEITY